MNTIPHPDQAEEVVSKAVEEAVAEFGRTPLINREHCRKFLLQYANDKRAHKFTRVSEETLVNANAWVESFLRMHVNRFPSKGQTL